MKKHKLMRWISKALYVFSLIIILFWRFSSHRWLAGALSQFFLKLFIVAFILAGLGALAMRVAEEMETRARDRGALNRR